MEFSAAEWSAIYNSLRGRPLRRACEPATGVVPGVCVGKTSVSGKVAGGGRGQSGSGRSTGGDRLPAPAGSSSPRLRWVVPEPDAGPQGGFRVSGTGGCGRSDEFSPDGSSHPARLSVGGSKPSRPPPGPWARGGGGPFLPSACPWPATAWLPDACWPSPGAWGSLGRPSCWPARERATGPSRCWFTP